MALSPTFLKLNFNSHEISTPCFVVDKNLLAKNLAILSRVREKTGRKILLA
ncbi:hypothetical protein EPICR_130004 [Candidatus Desulfarcum epimagneticum]|uniref:Uncharacterized protein n=1 Tax=uncultured Desulfobacteraceae bacterium TaxID=218296 RepID=A0A484HFA9_9BACT|nr:hypothetical protein EPICR_130004 [uncultured Desulfobacteraceae bacterium]